MHKSYLWLLILPVLVVAAVNVVYLWQGTSSFIDNAHPESLAVHWAQQVAEGKPLYTDFRKWPFNLTSFGPVYYFALGNMTRWFHLSQDDMFVWGRRLTFSFCVAIAFLIYWKSRQDAQNNALAALAVLLFLSSYSLWPVASVCRPDMLAALFSLSGILIYGYWPDRSIRMAALPLFLLAFFTKLSYFSAPLSICLYQVMRRNWKESLTFGGLYGLGLLLINIAMHEATQGLSTLNTIVSNLGVPMRPLNVRIVLGTFLQQAPLVVTLSFAGLAIVTPKRLEGMYFIVSFFAALLSSAKLGSGVNYFLEPLIAGSILIAAGIQTVSSLYTRTLVAVLFWVMMIPPFNFLFQNLRSSWFPPDTTVRQLVRDASGFVISENARLCLISRPPLMSDPFTLSALESRGLWSSSDVVQMLRKHQIEYVILYSPIEQPSTWQGFRRMPENVINAVRSEYRFVGVMDRHYVYVAKTGRI